MLSWGESGDEVSCDQQQNSSSSSSSRSSCSHLCLQSKANESAPPFTEHPPFLKIGCAKRGLKIDPPLITVSLKYLSASATFKHHSLLLGFYNPYRIPVLVMEIPTISLTCFEFILFSQLGRTLCISLFQFSEDEKSKCLQLTKLFFFSLLCRPQCRVVGICSQARLSIYIQPNATPQYV